MLKIVLIELLLYISNIQFLNFSKENNEIQWPCLLIPRLNFNGKSVIRPAEYSTRDSTESSIDSSNNNAYAGGKARWKIDGRGQKLQVARNPV